MNRLLLPLLLFLAGCTFDEKDLAGTWKADAFYENGQTMQTPLENVSLTFAPDGAYTFTSMGHYAEAGSFRTSVRYLFMTDTTLKPAREHVLEVLYLSKDTLKIRMEKAGNKQVLFLSRK